MKKNSMNIHEVREESISFIRVMNIGMFFLQKVLKDETVVAYRSVVKSACGNAET